MCSFEMTFEFVDNGSRSHTKIPCCIFFIDNRHGTIYLALSQISSSRIELTGKFQPTLISEEHLTDVIPLSSILLVLVRTGTDASEAHDNLIT